MNVRICQMEILIRLVATSQVVKKLVSELIDKVLLAMSSSLMYRCVKIAPLLMNALNVIHLILLLPNFVHRKAVSPEIVRHVRGVQTVCMNKKKTLTP